MGCLQPSPAAPAGDTSHLKNARGNQRADNVDGAQGSPEPSQSDGKFVRLVKVGEPKDNIAS